MGTGGTDSRGQVDLAGEVRRAVRRRPAVVAGCRDADGGTSVVGLGDSGRPDGGPADGRTLFEIGSITKVVTSLLLADAHLRGEVALDMPLQEVLGPSWHVPSRDGEPIRLWHLATHTAGLPRLPISGAEVLRLTVRRDPDPYARLGLEDLRRALAGARLRRRPGTGRLHYSNFGAGLLGEALVVATGAPDYAALVADRVTGPLRLADTVVTPTPEQSARTAQGHTRRGRPTAAWTFPTLAGAGALRSTVEDLLAFAAAYVEEDHPLAEAMALTRRSHGVPGIGLGWMLADGRGGAMAWHNGGTGGFRSFLGIRRDDGGAAAVLTNSARGVDLTGLRLLARG